jgi:hypothetical protein
MNSNHEPQAGYYEAALTQNQRHSLYTLLLSNLSIAQVRQIAPPWPRGLRQGRKPSSGSLGLIRQRLRIESEARQIAMPETASDGNRPLLPDKVDQTSPEAFLRQVIVSVALQMFHAALLEAVTVKNSYGMCYKTPKGPDPLFGSNNRINN